MDYAAPANIAASPVCVALRGILTKTSHEGDELGIQIPNGIEKLSYQFLFGLQCDVVSVD